MFDELHEECGVFGVYHVAEAASLTYREFDSYKIEKHRKAA